MNYQSAAFANLTFVFLGAFFGSLACILCGKIFKKKAFNFRLSLCFVLLSAAIVFAVLFVIKEKTAFMESFKGHVRQSGLVCGLYFLAGFLSSASLRLFFPAAALLYIAWTLSFGLSLYKKMPLPQKLTLTFGEGFVRDEASGTEWKFQADPSGAFADFALYELSPRALLPLPHYWFCLCGARPASSMGGEVQDVLEEAFKSEISSASGAKKLLARLFERAAKALLGKAKSHSVRLPPQSVYPVILELKAGESDGEFFVSVEKIM